MTPSQMERNPIDQLAEEFADRYRRGERPALSDYIRKYPELEEEIREVFPALVMMEQLKPAASDEGITPRSGNVPESIGDYRLLREIGRGGMGIVYEAEQVSLGRHVALKVYTSTGLTSPTYLERFRREAKAAARLHHTNIVPVFGVGDSGGVHYYAMQFIHGEGLDKVLADLRRLRRPSGNLPAAGAGKAESDSAKVAWSLLSGEFAAPAAVNERAGIGTGTAGTLSVVENSTSLGPPAVTPADQSAHAEPRTVTLSGSNSRSEYYRSIARIGLQVAEALAYAHKQGILHRDIKPSNLILDLQGTLWITDFGLAKADDADELTHTGDVVGTIRYMPPERFEGSSLPQGDIYAVGMTLYEMLTLRPAFDEANHARLIQRIEQGGLSRPRQLVRDVPRDLETIVLKAAARHPSDRYATAEALADDLRRFLGDRPIRARRHAAVERLWRWCRRNPTVASLTGALAALLIAVAIGSSFAAFFLSASKRDALEQLWRSKLNEARATTLSHQRGQRFTSLKRIGEALAIARKVGLTEQDRLELRNAAIAALALPDFEVAKEWDGWPAGSSGLDFDPALERYARSNSEGSVSVRRTSDDRELFALPALGQPATVRFSPTGRHLAVCGAGNGALLKLWQIDGPERHCIHDGTCSSATFTDFSPDGAQLAYESPTHLIIVVVATGQPRASRRLPGSWGPSGCGGIKWSPNGEWLAVGRLVNGRTCVQVRQPATGAVVASLWQEGLCQSFAWHPDGRLLAVGAGTQIHLWDVKAQARRAVLEGHKNHGITVAFNRSGDRLLSADWNGSLRLWDVVSGRQLLNTLGMGMGTFGLDDSHLACAGLDGKLQVLRFAPGREVRTLAGRGTTAIQSFLEGACLSRDGQLVAMPIGASVAGLSNGLVVLHRRTGRELARLAPTSQRPLGFAQDGSLWTYDATGNVLHWPQQVAAPNGTIRFGPPRPVVSVPGTEARAMSADGGTLVLGNFSLGALILHRGARDRLNPTGPQEDVRYAALSPDGRWVATGSHWCSSGVAVKVWNASTGRLEKQFTWSVGNRIQFSPDSRWFCQGGKLWRTGTWEDGSPLHVPGDLGALASRAAFAPNSRLLAVGGVGRIRLVRLDNGAEVARLTLAEQTQLAPECFTPDGAELLVRGEDTQDIHIWDLRLIRAQLAEMGLDWDDLPLPPASEQPAVPQAVEFVGADLVADAQKLRQYRLTLALLALSANPFDARAHFRLAQMADDPATAIVHYTASLAFEPSQPLAYENRAVAAFKLGRWTQTVADLDQVLKEYPDRPLALSYRAYAHQQLGQHGKAIADLSALLPAYPRDSRAYELRARSYAALGDKARADADRRKAEELAPDDPIRLNARAWYLVTGPPAQRDAETALKLARRAVDLTPNEAMHVNTLGVALYRNGQYRDALATLERSLALGNGQWDAFDLFFLAMCHHELRQRIEASDCFSRAVSWMAAHKKLDPRLTGELRDFQAEAQALLKLSVIEPGPNSNSGTGHK